MERMATGVSPTAGGRAFEVTWKIVVVWQRGRAGGALKALLDALFTKVTHKAIEMTRLAAKGRP